MAVVPQGGSHYFLQFWNLLAQFAIRHQISQRPVLVVGAVVHLSFGPISVTNTF